MSDGKVKSCNQKADRETAPETAAVGQTTNQHTVPKVHM